MKLLVPLRTRPDAVLAGANPLAKIGAATVLMMSLFASSDAVTPLVVLAGLAMSVRLTGIAPGDLLGRIRPVLLAAAAIAILNAAFAAEPQGELLLRVGLVSLYAGNVLGGLALGLRVVGVATAGVLALVSTDPSDLADALQQQLGVSPRVAVGALAAVRLMPILASEWQTLALARRARGVAAGRSPLAAVRILGGQLLALLVGAIRRGTRLALAMEARGFGARECRTAARPQRMQAADWVLLSAAVALGAGAIGTSLVLGTWRFLLS